MCQNCNEERAEDEVDVNRRRLLGWGGALAASVLLPEVAMAGNSSWAKRRNRAPAERIVTLFNRATGEYFKAPYWIQGEYVADAMKKLNHFLRDHHNDQVKPMDHRLVDLLFRLNQKLDVKKPIEITSAYRSPATNRRLIAMGYQASPRSLHLKGMAADIVVPGRSPDDVFRAALALRAGGVGQGSTFTHVDVGARRTWDYGV